VGRGKAAELAGGKVVVAVGVGEMEEGYGGEARPRGTREEKGLEKRGKEVMCLMVCRV